MIKNYFKTALRNLWRNKLTSSINIFGLSIGMTAAIFIFLWVQNEISFNNYHPGKEHIYRITHSIQVSQNAVWRWENSPQPITEAAMKEIPEVEQAARLKNGYNTVFNIDHKLFSEKTAAYVDKSWFTLFSYEFTEGSAAAFAHDPFGIILTESKAKKYFGNAAALSQVIRVDTVSYTVQGIIKDNPLNSSFQYDILMQLEGFLANPKRLKGQNDWGNFNYISFLKLSPTAKRSFVETKLNDIVNKNRTKNNDKVSLVSLPDIYFETGLQSSNLPHGNKKTTYIFTLLGLLLLIIACINYVNLTTAKASVRSKEVSIRKIIGAERTHLFFQFITESLAISLLSLLLTLLTIKLCLPLFNTITEKQFLLPLASVTLWKVLLGTLLVATLLNGIYPALLLSSFQPLNVFRGIGILKLRDGLIRKGLVIFQFVLSVVLIIGTIVMYRQMKYIQSSDPGYNVSQIVSVNIPYKSYGSLGDSARKNFYASIKHELELQSSIASVCTGGEEIVNVGSSSSGNADWDGRDTAYKPTIAILSVDADFQKMFQLQLKEGRWFGTGNEDLHGYIINETAENEFDMHMPVIGQRLTYGGDTGSVIGIVKDFHYKSMHEKIGPIVLANNGGNDSYFFIKTVPGNIPRTLSAIGGVWSQFIPDQPFSYNFLDDSFNTLYKSDIKTSMLIFIFSLIAIIISGLGLFCFSGLYCRTTYPGDWYQEGTGRFDTTDHFHAFKRFCETCHHCYSCRNTDCVVGHE
ncbi:MAG TPA: ABC transporter permease [Chitinophagaceae bacterium]|nr:ABC transporter permease [Chitinophagaceae bacterium]